MTDYRTSRVCALVPYPRSSAPSQRFRIEQWMEPLRSQGIEVDIVPFASERAMTVLHHEGHAAAKVATLVAALARRVASVAALGRYDAVVVHRTAALFGPAALERLIALRRPMIFDFDDAIFLLHTTSANRRFGWLKFSSKTATICRLSRHVVVGNTYLAEYARRYNPAVTIVPSSVDTDRYLPRERRSGGPLVIGWMGSATSQTHVELFAAVLEQLAARRRVEIRIISDRAPSLPGVPVVWRPWRQATEIAELQDFDIGIMPMPDDPWARGKCAMKALLYMAVGVPTVCSPVGANREVISHGENGLLAGSKEEWLAAIEALVDDPALRARLGAEGRATVEARYSTAYAAKLFGDVVWETLSGARS
jgi:glycosyltransferase involved in cell wall biosynthesis